jgi:hypothetical protein
MAIRLVSNEIIEIYLDPSGETLLIQFWNFTNILGSMVDTGISYSNFQ